MNLVLSYVILHIYVLFTSYHLTSALLCPLFLLDSLTASQTEYDHTQIFKITKSASGQWRAIGGELGFTIDELDSITREPGRHGDEDYYAAMLRRWLDWAPPNHTHPSLQSLQSVLRAVGKERQANALDKVVSK